MLVMCPIDRVVICKLIVMDAIKTSLINGQIFLARDLISNKYMKEYNSKLEDLNNKLYIWPKNSADHVGHPTMEVINSMLAMLEKNC